MLVVYFCLDGRGRGRRKHLGRLIIALSDVLYLQGASPKEQVLEACRRDNVELFQEVLGGMKGQSKEQIADFFNTTTDTMGNFLLHVCANYGSCTL